MFVSAARMFAPDVFANPLVHFLDRVRRRRSFGKESLVDVLPTVFADSSYEDAITLGIPLHDRSSREAQPTAYLGGDRDLPLSRQS